MSGNNRMSDAPHKPRSDALKKARSELAAKRMCGEVVTIGDPIQRAIDQPQSKPRAVAAMCFDCHGRVAGARAEIANCTRVACPLWPLRPHQKRAPACHGLEARQRHEASLDPASPAGRAAAAPKRRALAIRAFCAECMGHDPEKRKIASATMRLIRECNTQFPRPATADGYRGCPLWPHRPGVRRAVGENSCLKTPASATEPRSASAKGLPARAHNEAKRGA